MPISVHVCVWTGSNQRKIQTGIWCIFKKSLSLFLYAALREWTRSQQKDVWPEYTCTIMCSMNSRTQQTDPHQCFINDTICLPDKGQQPALVFMISCKCTSFSRLAQSFSSSISSRLLGYQIIFKPFLLWHQQTKTQPWNKSLLIAYNEASFRWIWVIFPWKYPTELDILIIYAHGDLLQPHAQRMVWGGGKCGAWFSCWQDKWSLQRALKWCQVTTMQ